jgi:hypothetical protein
VRPPTINSTVAALRFFFTVTLDRPDLARRLTIVHEPRRLPAVLSVEEVKLLEPRRAASDLSRPIFQRAISLTSATGFRRQS